MKLEPVTKLDQRNTTTANDDHVMSANCDVIVIFWMYDQLGAIRKSDSGRMVSKTHIFINNNNLLSYENSKQN